MTANWRDRTSIKDLFDGSSNTLLAGELHIPLGQLNMVPFNGPIFNGDELVAHSRIGGPGVPLLSSSEQPSALLGFGSWHPGSCNFVAADGSTKSYRNSLDSILLGRLCHREDGQLTSGDD